MANTPLCTYISPPRAGVHVAAATVYKQIRVKEVTWWAPPPLPRCRFRSPPLMPLLEQRCIFLQRPLSRGAVLSLLSLVELSMGLKKPAPSSSSAELTVSGLLHGSPLPSGLTPRLFSTISYAVHTVALTASPAPLWGGRRAVLATS